MNGNESRWSKTAKNLYCLRLCMLTVALVNTIYTKSRYLKYIIFLILGILVKVQVCKVV